MNQGSQLVPITAQKTASGLSEALNCQLSHCCTTEYKVIALPEQAASALLNKN